ncbi:MAG: RNA polymerase recycling motor ATPase HelR [Sporichthyaceae bacterium]
MSSLTSAFALPAQRDAKADPSLIGVDERHFVAIGATLEESIADLAQRLQVELAAPGGRGRAASDRDQEVHRLSARLRALRRFGLDLCLGRMVAEGGETLYVGRLGLTDADGRRLLIDWRSPAAEPFFGATHAKPMGLASRRRYRWNRGRIVDYWDEVFGDEGLEGHAALDDQSAFIASLGASRSPRMRDVLATIATDQDAIIRAGSRGALVVDGGPGTGKTVVALHRAAYLLYSDPRLKQQDGGVLFVGPSRPYLNYVADVLPSLGEEGVRTCTLADLVLEGATVAPEPDPAVARLKQIGDPTKALDAAVRMYEEAPTSATSFETDWGSVRLSVEDWQGIFAAVDASAPHNYARDGIWDELVAVVVEKLDDPENEVTEERVRRALQREEDLVTVVNRAWPLLDPTDLVGDLWTVPAYLRKCAPWLSPEDVRTLRREDPTAWTVEDLPWLDAARQRLGDPDAERRRARRAAVLEAERDRMADVVANILDSDDDGEGAITMLTGADVTGALHDEGVLRIADPDALAGPFLHIVVDEAQELTDAQWAMLLTRCPSRSFTIVGDRAQARHGFAESWRERLNRIGLDRIDIASLGVNYRTPEEVMVEAEPVIRAVLPDANVPTSIRSTGIPVLHGKAAELDAILATWLAEHAEGTACVIGDPSFAETARVRSLTPELSKGLEFDLVVLVDPQAFGNGVEGAVDRYVAMTRATRQLAVLIS